MIGVIHREFRKMVQLWQAANDGDAAAWATAAPLWRAFMVDHAEWVNEPLDRYAAIAELERADVSPETRFRLALRIAGKIAFKPGRPPHTPSTPDACNGEPLEPLDRELCARVLMDFGSASHPKRLHRNTRRALAEWLRGRRHLKPGASASGIVADDVRRWTNIGAAIKAHEYVKQGLQVRGAITRASQEEGVKESTIDAILYPRKRPSRRQSR